MEATHALAAWICGFLAGCVLVATLARWVHALGSAVEDHRREAPHLPVSRRTILGTALLHSGPWTLVIAAVIAYHVLSGPRAPWWTWVGVGLVTAPVFIGLTSAVAWVRNRQGRTEETALTPEVLASHRRRTLWTCTLVFGGAQATFLMIGLKAVQGPPLLWLALIAICMAGGYVFALFMWQWRKSQLEVREYERRKRASAA